MFDYVCRLFSSLEYLIYLISLLDQMYVSFHFIFYSSNLLYHQKKLSLTFHILMA